MGKLFLLVGILSAVGALVVAPACGGDACQTLQDELSACGGSTSSTSTGTSGGTMPPVCSDKEKHQAQCVLDARVNGAPIDLCKIKSKSASAGEQMAYDACYSASICADGTPAPCN